MTSSRHDNVLSPGPDQMTQTSSIDFTQPDVALFEQASESGFSQGQVNGTAQDVQNW